VAIEERADNTSEQTAGAENPEQGAGTGSSNMTPEEQASQAQKYVSAGEFGRRFGKLETQLQTMMSYIAAQQQAAVQRPQVQERATGTPTDEELWSAAQTGDRPAFEEYQRRIARRELQAQQQTTGRQNLVEVQLSALSQKYPVLNDSSHPLTQKAQTAYQLLVNNGYPANRATLLEAAKTAVADSPDLVSEIYSQGSVAREHARQSGVRTAQSGVTGVSHRQTPSSQQPRVTVNEVEGNLAARMLPYNPRRPDEKTPEQRAAGAKKRFLERQQAGLSTIDPRMLPVVERMQEEF
jgi:hypothetical protein